MSDQRPRDGTKQGSEGQRPPAAGTDRAGADGTNPPGQPLRPKDRPTDDPSEAPESGDRKATGNA
jgi:hypothetical protein